MLTYQIDWANPEGDQVRIDISKPLPLSGPPGHVTIQTQFFFTNDLDYLRYGNKGNKQALSISKMKAARYHDFGLELLVPENMWINDVCTYDISASYGWDAKGYEYKHDYTIIESPCTVVFLVSNNERKIMRLNKIYKFSDGTLTNIIEALDYRVKEYKVSRLNPGKLGNSDVHTLEDLTLILEILSRRFFLRLNLPDHGSVLTGSRGSSKDGDRDTLFQWSLFHNFKGTSRTTNNQAFTIKKGMSMPVQMLQAHDGKRLKVDDQRLDLADNLKEAQDHI
ncbi:hypothetical protein Tco_0005382 [Tanacetum coccineum]